MGDPLDSIWKDRKPRKEARGGWKVLRAMGKEDLWLVSSPVPAPRQTLTKIRHTHHQLARLIATGCPDQEASMITGYQPAYISTLKSDPSFRELLAYYDSQREQTFVDVVERMRALGLATLDELQGRLEEAPDDWSRRELMELAELMLVKPAAARTPLHVTGQAPVSVSVKFVTAQQEEVKTIDVTPDSSLDRHGTSDG